MITRMFSIFDSKAANFSTPFFMHTNGLAIRSFSDLVNDPKTRIHLHPEDYSLFYLGEFDDLIGNFVNTDKPVNLVTASGLRKYENVGKKIEQLDLDLAAPLVNGDTKGD